MAERPIYELFRRHRPDNRLSFHRWQNSSRRLRRVSCSMNQDCVIEHRLMGGESLEGVK